MTEHPEQEANPSRTVAVVGAGPAGLYAAQKLARAGVKVALINRDIKYGGLAEYGIYPAKHKLKEGLRKQFRRILDMPEITYFGDVKLGKEADISLDDLKSLPFAATLFTIGAQGTRTLGLPGEEEASGTFHAKDLVYHFNQLPPFATREFAIGKRVGIIGMGNVMVDIARWLICEKHVEEVVIIARRGPNERAYTDKEMREIIEVMDKDAVKAEMERITPYLKAVGQDPEQLLQDLEKPSAKAKKTNSPSKFSFKFLCTSKRIIADENGRISGLEVEYNELVPKGDTLRPKGTGETATISLDTLVYAIGDQVDPSVGLPYEWGKYIVNPKPHPIEGRAQYEVYDPEKEAVIPGWFVGGWARSASDGLVGKARADGETAAEELLHYLETTQPVEGDPVKMLQDLFAERKIETVTRQDLAKLEAVEQQKAEELGRDFFKFDTNEEMLAIIREK